MLSRMLQIFRIAKLNTTSTIAAFERIAKLNTTSTIAAFERMLQIFGLRN